MNRPETAEEILAMPDHERDAYAAEVCMGWGLVKDNNPSPFGILDRPYWNGEAGETGCYADEWEPSSQTEQGKAQAMDLAEKFELVVYPAKPYGAFIPSGPQVIQADTWQAAVVTAAILAALSEKE